MERSMGKPARARITAALVLTVLLYGLWGMAHNLNDILINQFRKAFSLSDLQSSLVQSCFYVAYLVMPIPVAFFLQRYGFKRGVIVGLCLYGLGALLFWPAAELRSYGSFLGALFVIACGLTFLETAGTGIVVVLGTPERAEWRINVAQAFNPIGSIVGILVGRQFIFSSPGTTSSPAADAHAVVLPYLIISLVVLTVAMLVAWTPFPTSATRAHAGSPVSGLRILLRSRLFMIGVVAQFFYVGTQIGVWSFLVRYTEVAAPGTSNRTAAAYLTASLVLFLAGRLITLVLLRRWSSAQIGMVFAACAGALTALAVAMPGTVGLGALIATSLFMSVMYPAIYAIGLHGNGDQAQAASALMIMAIVGGAVLTAAMGAISDASTIAHAYVVPLTGFIIVFAYCAHAVRSGRVGAALTAVH